MMFSSLKLENLVLQRPPLLFFIMTFLAILPLYFENLRGFSGTLFFVLLITMSFYLNKTKENRPNKSEKVWIFIAIIYAGFFILNYFLQPPYSEDGEWRNEAPIFILLFAYWYYLSIRFNQQKKLVRYVALSSILIAIALFFVELTLVDSLLNYRFGLVLDGGRGLAAIGFILPITTVLLAILWLQNRSWFYFSLMLIGFLLSGLNGSRTAFSMVLFPLIAGGVYLLFWDRYLSKKFKALMVGLIVLLVLTTGWLAKDKILTSIKDVSSIEQGHYMTSLGLRFAMFNTGMVALKDSWLTGVGPSHYKSLVVESLDKLDYSPEVNRFISGATQIHNQYLMTMILSGVIGLITLLLFIGYPGYLFFKSFKQKKESIELVVVGLVFGIAFVLFFGAIFTYTYTTIFYMLSMSALVSFSKLGWNK